MLLQKPQCVSVSMLAHIKQRFLLRRKECTRTPVEILKGKLHACVMKINMSIIWWTVFWTNVTFTTKWWHCDGFSFLEMLRKVVRNPTIHVILKKQYNKTMSDYWNNKFEYCSLTTTTTTTNFIENWKITNYITFPPANSLWTNRHNT